MKNKEIDYKVYENCDAWTPTNETPWNIIFSNRIKYANNDKLPILDNKFYIYRFNKNLTLERSSKVSKFTFEQPNDNWNKLIGPMDGPESPDYKDGTIFVLSTGVYSWEFHYQYDDIDKNNFSKDKTYNQELIDIVNNSIQEVLQKVFPEKNVQFSTMFEHNDVLIDGAKVAGTLIMSNDSGVWSHGMITWEYDPVYFSEVLPESQFKRLHRIHGEGKGITGIKNELPKFSNYTYEEFIKNLLKIIDERIQGYRRNLNECKP